MTSNRAATGILILFMGICCVCGTAVPLQAQQQAPSPPSSSQSPSQQAPMTAAQRDEMHGDILMARKMYRQAIQTYQDVLLGRGVTAEKLKLKKRGFFGRLFGVFRGPRLPQNHKNAQLLDKIGVAYQQLNDTRQAEMYYRRSSESDRHFASPLNNLGTVEFSRRNYNRAVYWYKKAIKVDSTVATTFSNMGYAYLAWNKYADAIVAFRQAILLDANIFINRGSAGSVIEAGGGANPGLYYYTLAKTFATLGNAASCAHFLKMSRDEGYKKYTDALKDPAFRSVLKDPRVMAILSPSPRSSTARAK